MTRNPEKSKMFTSIEHFYDFNDLDAFGPSVINLSAGAPGQPELEKCCNLFEKATKHCMVIKFYLKN